MDIYPGSCRGRVITGDYGEKSWVRFEYERLPNMCYWCGRLNHNDKECELWIQSRGTLTSEQKQFGPSLRAAPFQSGEKNVFFEPGFFDREENRIQTSRQAAETESGSPEVGNPLSAEMEKMTARVCIDEEKSINDGPFTNNEQTAAFNSNSISCSRFTLRKNLGYH